MLALFLTAPHAHALIADGRSANSKATAAEMQGDPGFFVTGKGLPRGLEVKEGKLREKAKPATAYRPAPAHLMPPSAAADPAAAAAGRAGWK